MPTNDERREVAAKLRDKAGRVCFDGCEVEECLFCGDWRYSYSAGDGARSYMRLADLIEPEERTCRDTWDGREFRCSACGAVSHVLTRDEAGDWRFVGAPPFCPNCGAKVVEE